MKSFKSFLTTIIDRVIQWRWFFVLISAFGLIIFEIHEHTNQDGSLLFDQAFLIEVLVYGITIPLFFGTLLSLYYTRSQLTEMQRRINIKKSVEQQLARARDWDELVTYILQVPRLCLPLKGSVLLLRDRNSLNYEIAGQWRVEGISLPVPNAEPYSNSCLWAGRKHQEGEVELKQCTCLDSSTASEKLTSWCYPLMHASESLGMMYFFIGKGDSPDPKLLKVLSDISIVLALAIENYRLRSGSLEEEVAAEAERQRISRYLHDTLVPDLAYLRLKLDQILCDGSLNNSKPLESEVARMLDVSIQSYDFVRDMLYELRDATQIDLLTGIRESAAMIGGRASFQTQIVENGNPMMLASRTSRQILLVVREALHNIEKHAQATQVKIDISWMHEKMIIQVTDDGIGPSASVPDQEGIHYGLQIIEETLSEVQGRFTFDSMPGNGTNLTVWIPLSKEVVTL